MKRKYLSIWLVICMVFTMLPTTVFAAGSDPVPTPPTAAEYAVGANNGTDYTTQGTTLTIKTAKGAAYWSANGLTYLNYTIRLDADIDVSGFQWTPVGITDGLDCNIPFSGTLDGQGHTISGISYANDLQDTGVIGSVSGGAIKSLTVCGSISVTQAVSGGAFVAGIVSVASDSTITDCHSKVQIESNASYCLMVGGIVAAARDNVEIDGCSNSGAISGSAIGMTFMGGIAGDIELLTASSSIKNCANTGALTANSIGAYVSLTQLGGIVGNKSDNTTSGDELINVVVENCYNTGALNAASSGLNYVGGISGNNGGDSCDRISNCYNAGAVSGSAILASMNSGIVGSNYPGSVFGSYWKEDTAATCVQAGGFVHNCGTFDHTGNLSATTNENTGTAHSENELLYGSDLLNALNGWVEANPDSGCCKWNADSTASPVNGGYPVLDVKNINFPGYVVTFNANGGNVAPATANTGEDGRLVSLPTPSRGSSYSFEGWFTEANGGTSVTASNVFSADTTLYAHWSYSGSSTITGGDSYIPPADNTQKTKDNLPVEVTAVSDSNGNANVTVTQDNLNEILRAAQQGGENGVVAELTVNMPEDARSLTLTLPQEVQDTLVKEHVTELKINSSSIEITFDEAALAAISQTAGMDVQITAKPSDVQSAKARAAIGNRPVLDLTLSYGGNTMSSFGTGIVYVAIPYTLGKNEQAGNIAVVYIDKKGKVNWLTNSGYDAIRKRVIFVTPHFSTYGVAYKSDAPKFKDIAGHWAKDDIMFVVSRGLLSGTAKGKFSPDLPITRGMLVTALGRMAQVDVNEYKKSSFLDVPAGADYKGYAEWANKNNILKGIGGRKYAPNAGITREQLAVILDRYATVTGFKLPAVYTECTFADADKIDSRAKDAVRRLQMAGIISSKTGNLFDPKDKATRAEVSSMLKRFIELTINN